MKDVLIRLVQTNIVIVLRNKEHWNYMEDYDITGCIICRKQGKINFFSSASNEKFLTMLIVLVDITLS